MSSVTSRQRMRTAFCGLLVVLVLGAGVTLEHTAQPGALPDEVLEDLVTRITEPV